MSNKEFLTREAFPFFLSIPTRWGDNDQMGHVNNVLYYRYIEALSIHFMMDECGLDWMTDPIYPLTVESLCRFRRPLSFPDVVEGGLRVEKIGNSSLTYDIALFSQGHEAPAATGHIVHVFVARETEKPVPVPDAIRAICERFGG
ncbi:MAG: acyl-CoA thioesterase [Rhodospirillales bacterium]|nr:acyl-CoA thioesterase [Rhodospirillales bacterium]